MNDVEREIFSGAAPDRAALLGFGFVPDGDSLRYSGTIVDGDFTVQVSVSPDGELSSRVVDSETGDEYLPIFAEAHVGAYVGRVREEYAAFLRKIAGSCFVSAPFTSPQANRLAAHILAEYNEREDRPFEKHPDCASFRSPATNKWYALVMPVRKGVLAGKKDSPAAGDNVEIVNLKAHADKIAELTNIPGIYPAYHMNRKHWISVLLDGTVDDETLFSLVAVSRMFADPLAAAGPSRYIVPSDPKIYDVDAHFEREGRILWHQPKTAKIGDVVYLYYGAPVSAVRWRCEIALLGLKDAEWGDPRPQMLLRPVTRYPRDFCTFAKLGEIGIRAVRATRRATQEFIRYMDSYTEGEK